MVDIIRDIRLCTANANGVLSEHKKDLRQLDHMSQGLGMMKNQQLMLRLPQVETSSENLEQQQKDKWQKKMRPLKPEDSLRLVENTPQSRQQQPPRQERHQKEASEPKLMVKDEGEDQTWYPATAAHGGVQGRTQNIRMIGPISTLAVWFACSMQVARLPTVLPCGNCMCDGGMPRPR